MKYLAEHVWKEIDDETDIMRVPGGALYRSVCRYEGSVSVAMQFVAISPSDAARFLARRHGRRRRMILTTQDPVAVALATKEHMRRYEPANKEIAP